MKSFGKSLTRLTQHVQPTLMPSAGELCFHPSAHDLAGQLRADHPAAETKHIGIVVLAAHPGREGFVAERSPDFPVGVIFQ
ncbi:hypothetical protein GCAAIG_05735 [Candidatus Electronema halotolerans]